MTNFKESTLLGKKTNFTNVNFDGAQLNGIINETRTKLSADILAAIAAPSQEPSITYTQEVSLTKDYTAIVNTPSVSEGKVRE